MECQRLNRLIRSWYDQLLDESMAPARMVEFMERHIKECEVCLTDPDVRYEVKKITAIILPENKIVKPAKKAKDEVSDEEETGKETSEEDEEEEEEEDSDEEETEEDDDDDD